MDVSERMKRRFDEDVSRQLQLVRKGSTQIQNSSEPEPLRTPHKQYLVSSSVESLADSREKLDRDPSSAPQTRSPWGVLVGAYTNGDEGESWKCAR